MPVYYYKERVMVEFPDRKRASFSRTGYGPLLEHVVKQSIEEGKKIGNPYQK